MDIMSRLDTNMKHLQSKYRSLSDTIWRKESAETFFRFLKDLEAHNESMASLVPVSGIYIPGQISTISKILPKAIGGRKPSSSNGISSEQIFELEMNDMPEKRNQRHNSSSPIESTSPFTSPALAPQTAINFRTYSPASLDREFSMSTTPSKDIGSYSLSPSPAWSTPRQSSHPSDHMASRSVEGVVNKSGLTKVANVRLPTSPAPSGPSQISSQLAKHKPGGDVIWPSLNTRRSSGGQSKEVQMSGIATVRKTSSSKDVPFKSLNPKSPAVSTTEVNNFVAVHDVSPSSARLSQKERKRLQKVKQPATPSNLLSTQQISNSAVHTPTPASPWKIPVSSNSNSLKTSPFEAYTTNSPATASPIYTKPTLADIIRQEQWDTDAKIHRQTRSLKEIQQEEEFDKWWAAESRKAQLPTPSTDEPKNKSTGGSSKAKLSGHQSRSRPRKSKPLKSSS